MKIDKTLSTPSSLKRLLSDGYHKSFIFQVERDYKLLGVAAGLLLWTSFHMWYMLYFVVVVIYFFECQFTFDCIFCGRRLFSRPTWLAAQVFLVSTMLIGRAAIFPFSFQLFSFHFCSFFSRGNLGRRMVEESTKIQDSDRFVKKHCLLSLFSFSTSFW